MRYARIAQFLAIWLSATVQMISAIHVSHQVSETLPLASPGCGEGSAHVSKMHQLRTPVSVVEHLMLLAKYAELQLSRVSR
jgi:hypothetical protein